MIEHDDCADFWWRRITGTRMLISDITEALINGKNVLIRIPDDLPWRKVMRTFVYTKFISQSDNSSLVINKIDDKDDNSTHEDPGKIILSNPENGAKAYGYRPQKGFTIQDYILKQKLLKNTVTWVKGLTPGMANKWLEFAKGYHSKSVSTGLFVLEINENIPLNDLHDIKVFDYAKCVTSYDLQVFNSFILDGDIKYSEDWKRYIATIAATVSGIDAEFSAALLDSFNIKNENIMDKIKVLAESSDFAKRGRETDSTHILSLYRKGDMKSIEHRIWKAQVHVLFPIIELRRIEIITKWKKNIQDCLDNHYIEQYGNKLTNYEDVEFGTLCYMLSAKDDEDERYLDIPCDMTRKQIFFLHECRNLLAHAKICNQEQVRQILD